MTNQEDNYYGEFPGGLLPSVYSRKKFLEFIEKYLTHKGLLATSYSFEAGNNLIVEMTSSGNNNKSIKYSYLASLPPVGAVSVSPSTFEYGHVVEPGDLTISVNITRKTYPLNNVTWLVGLDPVINAVKDDLSNLAIDAVFSTHSHNSNSIDGNSTYVAAGGSFKDTINSGGTLQCYISRVARNFWGHVINLDDPIDLSTFHSCLGPLPSALEIDHGVLPSYYVIVTVQDIKVYASGFTEVVTKQSNQSVRPYIADPSFTMPYNIIKSTGTSTGKYTYTIV